MIRRRIPRGVLAAAVLLSRSPLASASPDGGAPVVSAPSPLDAVTYVSSSLSQGQSFATFDGTNYLIGWSGSVWAEESPLRMARVSTAGTLLDPEAPIISSTPMVPFALLNASGAPAFLSAQGLANSTANVVLDVVGAAGAVTETTLGANALISSPVTAAAAAGGGDIVLLYETSPTAAIAAVVANATGTKLAHDDSFLTAVLGTVAANAQGFVYVQGGNSVSATRYGFDLTAVDATPIPVASTVGLATWAFAGATDTLVVWGDGASGDGNLSYARLGNNGVLEDTTPIALGAGGAVTGAWTGSGWTLAWSTPQAVVAAVVAANGTLTPATQIATATLAAVPSVVAGTGGQSLVAWSGVAARLDATGKAIDTQPIDVTTNAAEESSPVIARGQGGYLVAWQNADLGVVALRLDETGTPVDTAPVVLTSAQGAPQVAALGDEYLVTWSTANGYCPCGGATIDAAAGAASAQVSVIGNVLAAGGGVFLTADPSERKVQLLNASGAPVGSPIQFDDADFVVTAASAWNGTRFILAWTGGISAQGPDEVYAASLGTDGTLSSVSSALSGSNDGTLEVLPVGGGNVAIVGYGMLALVGPQATPIGSAIAMPVGSSPPALAMDAAGRALVVWQDEATYTSPQADGTMGMTIDLTASPPALGTPFQVAAADYGFGVGVASDGSSGKSFVVRASTSSIGAMPRASLLAVTVPLASTTCADDGGCPGDGGLDGSGSVADAGAPPPSAGPDAGTAPAASKSSGCGCAVIGEPDTMPASMAGVATALITIVGRRRGARRRGRKK